MILEMRKCLLDFPLSKPRYNAKAVSKTYENHTYGEVHNMIGHVLVGTAF
jgi:hypothetical protein